MTANWLLFGLVMPLTVLTIGLVGAYTFVRGLDREDEAARKRDDQPKA